MLKKQAIKSKPVCKVTFTLPDAIEAKTAAVVGEFNNWDPSATPLKRQKGEFKVTLELEKGRSYQYRYLVNNGEWYNDVEADGYVPNPFASTNSLVTT